jgi:hypothetical protein
MLVRSQDQEDLVKVLDFGVAKFLHDTDGANLTLTDATVGTPKYMAPEQIRGGGKVDFRSDIYALGAILYTMLAGGRLPIEGGSVEEIWEHKLTRDPYPLREYRSDLPADLEELILSCLAREPGQRPESAQALKQRLVAHLESARAMSDSIADMKSPSQTENVGDSIRRRRARLGIALGAVTAAAIAVIGIYLVRAPAPAREEPRRNTLAPPPVPAKPPAALEPPPAPTREATAKPAGLGAFGLGNPASDSAPLATGKVRRHGADSTAPSALPQPEKLPPAAGEKRAGAEAAAPLEPRGPTLARSAKAGPPEAPASDAEVAAAIAKAETAFSGGHMASARIAATQAVAAASGSPSALKVRAQIIMGKVELAGERYAQAERAFDRALAIDPQNPVAHKGKERARDAAAKARAPQ